MDIWKQIDELAKQAEQSHWLALEHDGDRATVTFLGDPFPREVVFVDGRYVAFDETHRARGLRATVRIAINVAVVETGEIKVLERGVLFFKELAAVRDEFPLDEWSFEIVRDGAAGDLKTTYRVEPVRELSHRERRRFGSLARHDLARLAIGEVATVAATAEAPSRGMTKLGVRDAQAIVSALRNLPREATGRLLERFAVRRVRDIPHARANDAMAFVDGLVRDAEVDALS